jgi:hypothetical protein
MLRVYVLLWVVTLLAGAAVAGFGLGGLVRHWLGLRLDPAATAPPSLVAVGSLAAHNLPVCGWPLLLGAAGAGHSRRRCLVADGLVAAALAVNVSLAGAAFGAYGGRLLAYVPQLPLEWLALAAGAGGWLSAGTRNDGRVRALAAVVTAAAVLGSAVVEIYAVPHGYGARRALAASAGGVKREPAATYR